MGPPKNLFEAAEAGDLAKIGWFLDQGERVDDTNVFGWTPLNLAAKGGHDQAVKCLLEHGADANKVNKDGWSALHEAARNGKVEAVKCLLDHGADVNKVDRTGRSALHEATTNEKVEAVRCLLDHNADVHKVNKDGQSALHEAARNGKVEALKCLLDHGADVNEVGRTGQSALHEAARNGKVEAVNCLLNHEADVNKVNEDGESALHEAARNGKVEAVKCLLSHGADVNKVCRHNNSALHYAARNGTVEAVKCLLDHGADVNGVNRDGNSALHEAAGNGTVEGVKCLLDHGADVNKVNRDGESALYRAAEHGKAEAVKCLLDHEADVNEVESCVWSALHRAARYGKVEAMKFLLDHGADVNKVCEDGNSALHRAARNGPVEAVKCLLDHEADINKVNEDGCSALHEAARSGKVEAVKCLLDHGADVNKVNKKGVSAFDIAVRLQHVEAAKCLLDSDDCVLDWPRKRKYDPVYLATSNGDTNFLRYLLAFGADIRMRKKLTSNREIPGILRKDSSSKDEAELITVFHGGGIFNKLIQAVQNNELDLLKSISEQDEKILKENGEMLLLESCKWGSTQIVDFLLCELNPREPKRSTPLHEAARRGHRRIVKLLLERDTAIDIRNAAGETPLHEAARWGKWPVAAFLIKHGARIYVMNKKGETPLDLATQNDWEQVAEVLRNPFTTLSAGKEKPESLEEVYESVTKGNAILDENLIKRTFTLKNVRGIRDLVVGHQVLEIGQRCGIIPTKQLDQLYFMLHFYRGIIGKLHTKQEKDVAQQIFRSAESQGILTRGEVVATLGDVEKVAYISETIAPVIADLTLRVQDLEKGFAEVRSAILQIQRSIQDGSRQLMYLAFLRLGLSFIPVAGGAFGTGVDVIKNALEVMSTTGAEVSNLCGLSTARMDVLYPPLTGGSVRSDLEELESLKERLSPEFLEALPEQPRNMFVNLVNTSLTGGIEKLRQELDNLLREIANNKDYLKSKETEVMETDEIREDKQPRTPQEGLEIHPNTQVAESEAREDDTKRGEGNECLTIGAQSSSEKGGETQDENWLLLRGSDEIEGLIEPLIRGLRLRVSEIERRTQQGASRGRNANLSRAAQLLEDAKKRMNEALDLLPG